MSRMSVLWTSSPRKVLGALGVVMGAAALAVGSGANFNSASANPSNVFTAGNLLQSNSKANQAVLSASKMKPGDNATGTVDIKNTGDIDGAFSLSKSNLVDTPASPAFSAKVDLKIEDLGDPACTTNCPDAAVKYDGKLSGMGTLNLGTFTPEETKRFKFTLTFPDGGSNGGDNAYKGASTSVQFDWVSTT
jgi:spore coat-associated protein N